jgi:hypothetical protein
VSVVDQAWERIGITGNHPIWSEDRHDYVAAMDLRVGERLKNLSGDTVWVQQKLPRPGPTPVYNLEVQDEHVYYVGASGVLAHNTDIECAKASRSTIPRDSAGRFASRAGGHTADAARGIAAHKSYRNALGGNYRFELKLPSGKRVDAVDLKNRIVRELKPDNPRSVKRGRRQLERYRQELESEFGGSWTAFLDVYTP